MPTYRLRFISKKLKHALKYITVPFFHCRSKGGSLYGFQSGMIEPRTIGFHCSYNFTDDETSCKLSIEHQWNLLYSRVVQWVLILKYGEIPSKKLTLHHLIVMLPRRYNFSNKYLVSKELSFVSYRDISCAYFCFVFCTILVLPFLYAVIYTPPANVFILKILAGGKRHHSKGHNHSEKNSLDTRFIQGNNEFF